MIAVVIFLVCIVVAGISGTLFFLGLCEYLKKNTVLVGKYKDWLEQLDARIVAIENAQKVTEAKIGLDVWVESIENTVAELAVRVSNSHEEKVTQSANYSQESDQVKSGERKTLPGIYHAVSPEQVQYEARMAREWIERNKPEPFRFVRPANVYWLMQCNDKFESYRLPEPVFERLSTKPNSLMKAIAYNSFREAMDDLYQALCRCYSVNITPPDMNVVNA